MWSSSLAANPALHHHGLFSFKGPLPRIGGPNSSEFLGWRGHRDIWMQSVWDQWAVFSSVGELTTEAVISLLFFPGKASGGMHRGRRPSPEQTGSLLHGDRPAHPFHLPEPLGFALNQRAHLEVFLPSSIPSWLTHRWTTCGGPPILSASLSA